MSAKSGTAKSGTAIVRCGSDNERGHQPYRKSFEKLAAIRTALLKIEYVAKLLEVKPAILGPDSNKKNTRAAIGAELPILGGN